jgi:hypothetical protein
MEQDLGTLTKEELIELLRQHTVQKEKEAIGASATARATFIKKFNEPIVVEQKNRVMAWGKHMGKTLDEIVKQESGYAHWMVRQYDDGKAQGDDFKNVALYFKSKGITGIVAKKTYKKKYSDDDD